MHPVTRIYWTHGYGKFRQPKRIWVRSLNDVQLPIFGLSSLQTLAELSNVHLFLYFSVPMYRKQLGLSENIYLCSLSLDFLAVIAFQSSKNHENSDFPRKIHLHKFLQFFKIPFHRSLRILCTSPHISVQISNTFRMSGCKITRTRQGWIGVGRKTERLWSRLVCLVAEILNDSIQSKCLLHLVAHTSYQS